MTLSVPIPRLPSALLIATLALLLPSCGGGGSIVTPPPPPPPAPPPLAISTQSLPSGLPGTAYSFMLQATGGTPPYSWSVANPAGIPPGLTLSPGGAITGTPTVPWSAGLDFQVRDAANRTAASTLSIRIADLLRIQTSATLPGGNLQISYFTNIDAVGGIPPFTFSLSPGSNPLPPGLSLNGNNGVIQGTPTAEGTYSFNVTARDQGSVQQTVAADFQLFVDNQVFILTQSYPFGVIGKSYRLVLQAVGGTTPYTWTFASGSLPPGLSLNPTTGEITGTPAQAGTFSGPDLQVTDSSSPPRTNSRIFGYFEILPTIFFQTSATLPDAAKDVGYGGGFITIAGGTTPYTLQITGNLPPGTMFNLGLQSVGLIDLQGIPTQIGQFSFTVQATDSSFPPDTVQRTFTVTVQPQLLFNTTSIPDGLEGQPYSFTLQATSGVPPYTWFLQGCSGYEVNCPPGLSLNSATGEIFGTPVFAGVRVENIQTNWFIEVFDSSNPPQRISIRLPMNVFRRLKLTSSLPPVRIAEAARLQLAAYGGVSPHTWRLISGSLPAGLSLNGNGEIAGIPTSIETAQFSVEARDSGQSFPQVAQQTLSLSVVNSPGRNDTLATATPLSIGRYRASLSPHVDPVGAMSQPDTDFYRVTALAGEIVTVETFADRLSPPSASDTVIELLDANGQRLSSCREIDYGNFFDPCVNDDSRTGPQTIDSKIQLQVPGTPGTQVTFYVRVLDWTGDARPEFRYEISISGAN